MKHLLLSLSLLVALPIAAQDIRLPERPNRPSAYRDYEGERTGYWSAVEALAGSTVMFKRHNMPFTGAMWTNGYRLGEYLRLGLGLGFKYYVNNDRVHASSIPWTFPIALDVRGNILSAEAREAVPFWSVDVGGEVRGGFYLHPAVGYRFGQPRSSFVLSLGYQLMQADTHRKKNDNLNAVVLKLGYEF